MLTSARTWRARCGHERTGRKHRVITDTHGDDIESSDDSDRGRLNLTADVSDCSVDADISDGSFLADISDDSSMTDISDDSLSRIFVTVRLMADISYDSLVAQ